MSGEPFLDAALFMGMHNRDDEVRRGCKRFFTERLSGGHVLMSLEHVGRCDDLVWRYPRQVQDEYYPFMDNLHSDMAIDRIGYDEQDLRLALDAGVLSGLPLHERLLVAMAMRRDTVVVTASPRLSLRPDLPVLPVEPVKPSDDEPVFPAPLERLYERSLALRVDVDDL
ncbi:DUF6190 family protein [Microbispora bryophytorum]|uniref:Uncharacterized protein n=1 Tax=Microbispora bryophytorum TaxID=1460882 RepID=A0A8H9GY19_9ACTN|nr:DUF6190 family protein [Microbispora bryophytorum]MBD3135189.1 hypothetical protein [Microbispora bryophytorum]TQS08594.1 hypothetical protein FLX07_04830 [Microbispora bryophytorum]GGO10228.1 hypothetical protein GCM10011574_26490 [Microbispora bryophytorum]